MNDIPDDEERRLAQRFGTAASKLTPTPRPLAEIRGLVQRRLRRRRVTRIATVVGAAAAVVAVVLTVNAVTGPTTSRPVLPAQSGTPSPSQPLPSTPPPTPTTTGTGPLTSFPSLPSSATAASVVKQITLPGSPADAIAIDAGVAYVVDGGAAGAVSMLDLSTDVVGKAITVGAAPVAVAVDPILHTAYVANSGSGTVSVIDKASAKVVATVKVGAKPVAIAVDSTRHLAYVVNNAANSASILDETTNTVASTLQVGQGPIAVVVDTGTNTIFVANTNSGQGSISRINGASRVVTPTEALGSAPLGLTLVAAASALYVDSFMAGPNGAAGAYVSIMDEKTLFTSGVDRLTFDGAGFAGSVLDADTNTLYVVTPSTVTGAAGKLLVLPSPDFMGQAPFVSIGEAPKAIALDLATHYLYVVNGDNTITLVAGIGSSSHG